MQTLLAVAILVVLAWFVVLPAFALLFIKPNDRYYEIWVNGVVLIGAIACVVGEIIELGYASHEATYQKGADARALTNRVLFG